MRMLKLPLAFALSLAVAPLAPGADRDKLKLDQHISGDPVKSSDLEGKIIVVHQWQAH